MHAPRAAGLAAIVAVLTSPIVMAIEEPTYRMLEQDGSFELREYSAYVVAETRVEADFSGAGSVAFQRLFRYISGNNTAQQKIVMTAPWRRRPSRRTRPLRSARSRRDSSPAGVTRDAGSKATIVTTSSSSAPRSRRAVLRCAANPSSLATTRRSHRGSCAAMRC